MRYCKLAIALLFFLSFITHPVFAAADDAEALLCGTIDLREIVEDMYGPQDDHAAAYFALKPNFEGNQVEEINIAGQTVYKVQLAAIRYCEKKRLSYPFITDDLLDPKEKQLSVMQTFAADTLKEDFKVEPRILQLKYRHSALPEYGETRSAASTEELQIESALRYQILKNSGSYTVERLVSAASASVRTFSLVVVYQGLITESEAKTLIADLALVLAISPTEVALLGENYCSDIKLDSNVMFFDSTDTDDSPDNKLPNKALATRNYSFESIPIFTTGCGQGFAYQETLSSPKTQKNFDETDSSGNFYIIELLEKALNQMGVNNVTVHPIGPIEKDQAYVLAEGMKNRINRQNTFSGNREERIRLSIKREAGILTINQRYEYNIWSGTQRWRDPEDPQYADPSLSNNAKDFLGQLIAQIKLLMAKRE
ncbi:UNVERIFIED_ORG: hypothetical protein J2Y81_001953 [Paraburkholderia sediminicola]|nr:hypothetical protein [Paraburkholderia sediminicola]